MANFSCYVTIINKSSIDFKNARYFAKSGSYESQPTEILAGQTIRFRLRDPSGPQGAEGRVVFSQPGSESYISDIEIEVRCPYSGDNFAFISECLNVVTKSYSTNDEGFLGTIPAGQEDQYPKEGHPLSCVFVIENEPKR